jgi:cysteine desulfurase
MAREQVAGLINANPDPDYLHFWRHGYQAKIDKPPGKPPKAGSNLKPRLNQDKEKK